MNKNRQPILHSKISSMSTSALTRWLAGSLAHHQPNNLFFPYSIHFSFISEMWRVDRVSVSRSFVRSFIIPNNNNCCCCCCCHLKENSKNNNNNNQPRRRRWRRRQNDFCFVGFFIFIFLFEWLICFVWHKWRVRYDTCVCVCMPECQPVHVM